MKLIDVYRLAIQTGIEHDLRPKEMIDRILEKEKARYDSLNEEERSYFDMERLWNPYGDTRLSYGDGDLDVKRLMWGIDIETGEVLLADRLREKGERIDGIVGHHPLGSSKIPFPEVIDMQNELYHGYGVPYNMIEGMMGSRMAEVKRGVHPSNYNQAVDAAKLLDIPIMNIHAPADNCVEDFLSKGIEKESPTYVSDIVDYLMSIEEFKIGARYNCRPLIAVGSPSDRCGKVVIKMNGGTSSPKDIYSKLEMSGIGTVVGMHFPENHIEEARKHNIRLVVSGHMPSDSLGVNLICDVWEKAGVDVIPCSGLIRVSRN